MIHSLRKAFAALLFLVSPAGSPGTAHAQYGDEAWLGQVSVFAMNFCPHGWLPAQGQELAIRDYIGLHALYGTFFGGDGRTTFGIPDLEGQFVAGADLNNAIGWNFTESHGFDFVRLDHRHVPAHEHRLRASATGPTTRDINNSSLATFPSNASAYAAPTDMTVEMNPGFINAAGGGRRINVSQPFLAMTICVKVTGQAPSFPGAGEDLDREPMEDEAASTGASGSANFFLGDVFHVAYRSCPTGSLPADARSLPLARHADLFAVIDNRYGDASTNSFRIPGMSNRIPVHPGPTIAVGDAIGSKLGQMDLDGLPAHGHEVLGNDDPPNSNSPQDGLLARFTSGPNRYAQTAATVEMAPGTVGPGNSEQARLFSIVAETVVLRYCIAVTGATPPPG